MTNLRALIEQFDDALGRCALYGNADQVRDNWSRLRAALSVSVSDTPLDDASSFEELDRRSIRTGCETADNRAADCELRRRGYHFNASKARWEYLI